MSLTIEIEQEDDGRWIAEAPALPATMAYGGTREEAIRYAQALAFRVIADRLEHGEPVSDELLAAWEEWERAATVEGIGRGLEASDAGRVRPFAELAAEMRAKFDLPTYLTNAELCS